MSDDIIRESVGQPVWIYITKRKSMSCKEANARKKLKKLIRKGCRLTRTTENSTMKIGENHE